MIDDELEDDIVEEGVWVGKVLSESISPDKSFLEVLGLCAPSVFIPD